MGIISRFGEIMKANINDLLDKCEDPSKMIDQTLRSLTEELAEVKTETAAIMAEETSAKRRVNELQKDIDAYTAKAKKAIMAGEEGDAKVLLEKKQQLEQLKVTADSTYTVAKANSEKMQQMYNKLNSDIASLNSRRETIKAQVSMAKAQERVADVTATIGKSGAMDTFSRMESKAQKMLDQATAKAELSGTGLPVDEAADIAAKYDVGATSSVDNELARLKAEMGM